MRSSKTERRLVERARVVLLAAAGTGSRAIGRKLGCARGVISKWRLRFARGRLAGLADAPRSGKPRTYGETSDRRICSFQVSGPFPNISASLSPLGCRPSRIASTMSGAKQVSGRNRQT